MDALLDFSGQVVLITGAGSGFGRLLSLGLANRGAKLVLSDINETALEETKKDVKALTDVVVLAGNIASESLNKALVETAIETFGKLDIAVNNAGIAHNPAPIHQMTEEIMDSQFAVNVPNTRYACTKTRARFKCKLTCGTRWSPQGRCLCCSKTRGFGDNPHSRGGIRPKECSR